MHTQNHVTAKLCSDILLQITQTVAAFIQRAAATSAQSQSKRNEYLLVEHRLVTDRQTDRHGHGAAAGTRVSIASRR